jgi:hypothetical protein
MDCPRKKFGMTEISTNSFTNYYIEKILKKFGLPYWLFDK